MKHLLILFLSGFIPLFAFSQSTKTVERTFSEKDYTLTKYGNAYKIGISKHIVSYESDSLAPALPFIAINVLLAPDKGYDNFSYEVQDSLIAEDLLLNSYIPSKKTSGDVTAEKGDISYSSGIYPSNIMKFSGIHILRGFKYISFLVSPFRYDAYEKRLYLNKNIQLKINEKNEREIARAIPSKNNSLYRMVVNPQDVDLYSLDPIISDYDCRYLIVTCDSLKPEFQKLADWKTSKGVPTKVLTTESIYEHYTGGSPQLKIKAALKDYYDGQYSGLEYVLLGGDVEIVPAQIAFIEKDNYFQYQLTSVYRDQTPSDWFYGCFDTMEWDTNNNGWAGELTDSIDIAAEVVVSRLPVKTKTDVKNLVTRIIRYEWNPSLGYCGNRLLMSGMELHGTNIWNGATISDVHYLYEEAHQNQDFPSWSGQVVRLFDTGTDFSGGANYDFSSAHLQTELSKGYPFVSIDTHGPEINDYFPDFDSSLQMEPYVMHVFDEDTTYTHEEYDTIQASVLKNKGNTVMLVSACQNNRFDDSRGNCLGETFMKNPDSGIVAYIGISRDGWFSETQDLNKAILQGVFKDYDYRGNLGYVFWNEKNNIVNQCYTYASAKRWLLFTINMLGDPEMPVVISNPIEIPDLTVSYTNNTLSVYPWGDNTLYCIMSRDDLGESFYEVGDGSVDYPNITNETTFLATKEGCIPYVGVCAPVVHLQNEKIYGNYHVFSTTKTEIGRNIITSRDEGDIIIENGKTTIKAPQGVTIHDSFEVKLGAELEIMTEN